MNPEQFARVQRLFDHLCDLEAGQWEERLAELCPDDDVVRDEVMGMLMNRADTAHFSGVRDDIQDRLASRTDADHVIGEMIGDYQLMRRVGRGGMGSVFLAVRVVEDVKRRFAIKLVRKGVDTEDVLERFKLERKLLAALEHPGIAHVYDAGTTTDGRPYLVMEYVEGQPIDRYCDANELSTDDRLALFRKVCEAVHYAHQNLVIHRDIKPSNILVTPDGEPKLLDFGVAKLLNPALADAYLITRGDHAPMTPEYASPEQVRGEPVTTATDVYSLGVLLYELLTGRSPYQLESRVREEAARIICNADPDPPSAAITRTKEITLEDGTVKTTTPEDFARMRDSRPANLRRRLAGDLDNITLMAMRKSPSRRYDSVEQFAADIQRHLDRLPVKARRDTIGYHLRKFVVRHRVGVAAAAFFVLWFMAGFVSVTWLWQIAEDRRVEVEVLYERSQKRTEQLASVIERSVTWAEADRQLDWSTRRREVSLMNARRQLDALREELAKDQTPDPMLSSLAARLLIQLARLQVIEQESASQAAASLQEAAEHIDVAYAGGEPVDGLRINLLLTRSRVERLLGNTDAAIESLSEMTSLPTPQSPALRRLIADGRVRLGNYYAEQGELERGDQEVAAGLAQLRDLSRELSATAYDLAYADALRLQGVVFESAERFARAVDLYEQSIRTAESTLQQEPANRAAKQALMLGLEFKATAQIDRSAVAGHEPAWLDDAAQLLERRLPVATALADEDPADRDAYINARRQDELLGNLLFAKAEFGESRQHYLAYLPVLVEERDRHPDDVEKARGLAQLQFKIGRCLISERRFAEAIPHLDDAMQEIEEERIESTPHPKLTPLYAQIAFAMGLANWRIDAGRCEDAYRTSIRHFERVPEEALDKKTLARAHRSLGTLLIRGNPSVGQALEAVVHYEKARELDGNPATEYYAYALTKAELWEQAQAAYVQLEAQRPLDDDEKERVRLIRSMLGAG